MADNKRASSAARRRDAQAACWLLKRWRKHLPSETVEILENLSKRKAGRPPAWRDPALNAYIYELVEAAKERFPSSRQAWKQVSAYFKAGTVAAHRKARSTNSDMWKSYYSHVGPKSYSLDQIKRVLQGARARTGRQEPVPIFW
jgi:hypothetical protein